ncbi:MAG TPA: taurine catabolism dioxygenase TauD [Sedimenticola sp.]|nr:taurine catabolism dioxygenase TauD [Sedimenticola sp.]
MKPEQSPFVPGNEAAYQGWREQKLRDYPGSLGELVVEIENPAALTPAEHDAILQRVRKCGMAIYASARGDDPDKALIRALGRQFGLERLDHNMCADEDAISSLAVQPDALHQGYIPYTTRPIAWHTDGYYNPLDHQIHALLLHCVRPAASGGANRLLDHEILFMELRDQDPAYVKALMHPGAMTIPANVVEGKTLRPARSGPVFMLFEDGRLHMRYTDRSRSIEWRDDPLTREAVAALKGLLAGDRPYRFEGTLQSGQGLICGNVLHTRSGFENGEQERLLYRARYFDRIAGG